MPHNDSFTQRPRIAHITNHGYGGVNVPTGGAPDTGGQNVYVNAVVEAMVELGYHVTVFARGGFPFFDSERMRDGVEPYGEHARYVYVPGGGDTFIRKEDIAPALDEEVDWFEKFVAQEAKQLSCRPWEVYEIVNTHYWDAGVMGMLIVERWRSQRAGELLKRLLEGTLVPEQQAVLAALDTYSAIGQAPDHFVGQLLYDSTDELKPPVERTRDAIQRWCEVKEPKTSTALANQAASAFDKTTQHLSPALASLAAADIVGKAVLALWSTKIPAELEPVERHVFTPHSLGVLKEENFRNRPVDVVRNLKFCERRNHEIALCRTARAFAATSTEIAERLRTHLDVETERMFFFPPCVDRSVFKQYEGEVVDRSYDYLAEKSGVDAAVLRKSAILYETSRMDRTKRKDLLLQAFAKVAREVDDAYLFIGGGPDNDVFKSLQAIREADPVLQQRAFLLGFVPNEAMYPLFGMADIFASASEMEGFGMSVAQAAAVGTPIIASHLIPFAVQYVPDDALIVRAGDVDGFAAAMLQLLGDPDQRKQRGQKLEELTASLDWVVQAEAFLEHLRRRGLDVRKPGEEIVIGDKLIISDYHRQGAARAMETIKPRLGQGRLGIVVSGESGSGKSEIGEVLRESIVAAGYKAVVLGQDDYFKKPPKTNGEYRKTDIGWVGPGEVHLDVMNENMATLKAGAADVLKPLVYFDEDRITEETLTGGPFDAIIAEGTYTSLLEAADIRVFIDRTYHQTKKARLKRARDEVVGFIEQVLEIEHKIISKEKARADVVIAPPPEEA